MKRLITCFQAKCRRSAMTLLLLFMASMCWADGYIHIWKADGTGDIGDVLIKYDSNTPTIGTASFTMDANVEYGIILRDYPNGATTATEYGFLNSTVESDNTYKLEKQKGGGYIKSNIGGICNFTVEWVGSNPQLTAKFFVKDKLRYRLQGSNIYSYADITYVGNDGETNINMLDNKIYEFQISDGSGTWYGCNSKMTSNNCTNWNFYTNTSACKIETSLQGDNIYSYNRVYTFKTKWGNGNELQVSAIYQRISDYYLIVPDENVGNTAHAIGESWVPTGHKAFKMVGGRERNQSVLNPELVSLTLKIDGNKGRQLRYDSNDKIKFYIYDKANDRYYQPDKTDYDKVVSEDGSNYVDGTNVELKPRYRTSNERDAIGRALDNMKDRNQNRYYYIKKGSTLDDGLEEYPTMSLTFMFSQYNAEKNYYNKDNDNLVLDGHFNHGNCIYYVNGKKPDGSPNRIRGNAKLLVAFLKTRAYSPGEKTSAKYYNEHIIKSGDNTPAGVYLVGAMGGTYLNGSEKEYDKTNYKMEPIYWKDGVINESLASTPAEADSIVYSCEIRKGDAAWDNFFLSFSTGDMLGKENEMWNPLLRPRVQNKMDAQALEGGVFYYLSTAGKGSDQAQALNPLLTEEQKKRYVSYRVYFNATYSTYRIEFYDGFYIAGPAVNNSTDNSSSGEYFDKSHRYAMKESDINGFKHYVYTGNFKKGGTFAFFVNEETTIKNYSEDKNSLTDDKCENVWNIQVPNNNGGDYAFYNKVRWNENGGTDNQSLGSENNAIVWTLPDGEYTLRFYNHAEQAGNNQLYTIDKKIRTTNITIEYNGDKKNYKGWNGFSDDCALWLPSGIKAYYAYDVAEEADGKKVVKLRELKGGYIPAHCGVLLYNDKLIGEKDVERLNYSPLPMDYTKDFASYKEEYNTKYPNISDDVNLLMDCSTTDKLVELEQLEGGYYNYYFTYRYNTNGVSRDVPLNFWKVLPKSKPNKNSTYLHVNKQITPLAFDVNTNNYYLEDAATVANNAKGAYCLFFSIDDVDNSEVTDIRIIQHDAKNNASDNIWYNMQGMRVSKPTTAGIYINNGKKIVIK